MNLIKPEVMLEDFQTKECGQQLLKRIEKAGRTCYKSEDKITDDTAEKFVKTIIKSGHESVLEHEKMTVRVICDRGVSHEIVRHRIGSYSQESTRYCNYSKDKFNNGISIIYCSNHFKNPDKSMRIWAEAMAQCEKAYLELIEAGETPQIARNVLPNSLKTEIVITYNMREWRHFFRLRTSTKAHPQMREVAIMILNEMKRVIPVMFDDIIVEGEYIYANYIPKVTTKTIGGNSNATENGKVN